MNIEQLLLGKSSLLKVQITYCGDFQTLLGITVARVVTGMRLLAIKSACNLMHTGLQQQSEDALV